MNIINIVRSNDGFHFPSNSIIFIPSKRILSDLKDARLVMIEAVAQEYCPWVLTHEFLSL